MTREHGILLDKPDFPFPNCLSAHWVTMQVGPNESGSTLICLGSKLSFLCEKVFDNICNKGQEGTICILRAVNHEDVR